jgi:hypothetical protein
LHGQHTYGLHNALYDCVARIALTGQLIDGAACEIPHIEEQLYALSLQFATVKTGTITVNGELLQDLLDLSD